MPNTYTLISSVTVGAGGASSIDFTSIPSTYTDILIKYSIRNSQTGAPVYAGMNLTFNNDGGSNYSQRLLYSDGSSAASASQTTTAIRYLYSNKSDSTASTFSNIDVYVPNYAGSNQKSLSIDGVLENNATQAIDFLTAALWTGTSAINQVTITPAAGTFLQYSTAYLYGIKNS